MRFSLTYVYALLAVALTARAQPAAPAPGLALGTVPLAGQSQPDPRASIAARMPELRPEQITPSPIPGLFEIRLGSKLAYVSADGRYLFSGDIIEISSDRNVTEGRREALRKDLLASVGDNNMVVFAPARFADTVTVFTDIDCGYCRKLHKQIADYNARGIRVRYMFFPRSGPGTDSWRKAEQVWCSTDRRSALTLAKAGNALDAKVCAPNPVARHYTLGRDIGLQGTPAIVLESGELIGGYLDPAELADYIKKAKAPKPAKAAKG